MNEDDGRRDMFAAAALIGILAHEGCIDPTLDSIGVGDLAVQDFAVNDARRAYIYADAMLRRGAKR